MPESGVTVFEDLQISEADVVHGIRHEDKALVTLLGASGYTWGIPHGHVTNSYDVELALVGRGHATSDAFDRVDLEFDYLKAWAQPPSRIILTPDDRDIAQIRTNVVELAHTTLSDGAGLRLYSGVAGSLGDDVTNLVEYCALSLTVLEPVSGLDLVSRVLRPTQDLLMVSLGRAVRLTEARLSVGSGRERLVLTAHFPVDQRRRSPEEDLPAHRLLNNVLDYRAATLLTAHLLVDKPLPLLVDDVLQRWFDREDGLDEVLSLLLAPFYARDMAPEHRYASTFQSAEALHNALSSAGNDTTFSTKELSKGEHQARVLRVLDDLREGLGEKVDEDLEWAGRVLRGRNDRSLPQKVGALLIAAGPAGEAILAAAPGFAGEVTELRARVSHGGAGKQPHRRQLRAAAEEALRWLVRAHLISQILLPPLERPDFWDRMIRRHKFQRCLQALHSASDL